jgi:hypothetical protein
MPSLDNSQRRIYKATYVSIRANDTDEDQERRAKIRRPLEKLNFLRSLDVRPGEVPGLTRDLPCDGNGRSDSATPQREVLNALAVRGGTGDFRLAPLLATMAVEELADLGRHVARTRRRIGEQSRLALDEVRRAYAERRAGRVVSATIGATAMTPATRSSGDRRMPTSATAPRRNVGFGRPTVMAISAAPLTEESMTPTDGGDSADPGRATIANDGVLGWALVNGIPAAQRLRELLRTTVDDDSVLLGPATWAFPTQIEKSGEHADQAVDAFLELMHIEPIGRLHLERLEMVPVGVERGELVYSIPLAPMETVNLSHKEWSIRSEEFEQIVQDVFEEFSEEGVAEKNDLSRTTQSQERHATAYTLSGSYSYYGASVSVGYNSSSEDQQAQQDSRQQSISMTRKASSRAKQDHKHSFKVESVVGREEQSIRVISNPSPTDPMRLDYYQLMRKWRTDLYRYGLRMTYDIVIPSPGAGLIQKLDEIRGLDARIDEPFVISIQPNSITRDNWEVMAGRWTAKVDAPPSQTVTIYRHDEIESRSKDEAKQNVVAAIEFRVDPDYTITSGSFEAVFSTYEYDDIDAMFDVLGDPEQPVFNTHWYNSTLSHLRGMTGDLAVVYTHIGVGAGSVQFTLTVTLTTEAYRRWQYESWVAIRDAAEQTYYANRQLLTERRERLLEELKQWDALTLRRMEREEIMQGVLRWLFGPDFALVPAEIQAFFEPIDAASGSMPAGLPGTAGGPVVPGGLPGTAAGPVVVSGGTVFTDEGSVVTGDGPAHPGGSEPVPPEVPPVPPFDVLTPTEENWRRVLQFGEMIKFLHQAIEWENVMYFTYPYFWDSPRNWQFKRFLRHPDAIHREFLRSGSARVVLTIRPGYEVDFAEFVESGALGQDHPYMTIAQEIQAYTRTNYPGIPPANPEDGDADDLVEGRERGVLIGRWYEYTPTSALDISVDTPLGDIA